MDRYHPAVLNVILLEAGLHGIATCASELSQQLSHEAGVYWSRKNIRHIWSEGPQTPERSGIEYWKPGIYATWGSFDVAAPYLSPHLHLTALHRGNKLGASGQHIHQGLLPILPGVDFNHDYVRNDWSTSTGARRYFAFLKLKLSPAVSWPREREPGHGQFDAVLAQVAEEIQNWREKNDEPTVALAEGFGWSELLVVAHMPTIEPLLLLAIQLRELSRETAWAPGESAHVFLTTMTKLGYDSRIFVRADQAIEELRDSDGLRSPRSLVDLAKRFATDEADRGTSVNVVLRTQLSAYPGHEGLLQARIRDLASATPESWLAAPITSSEDESAHIEWHVGNRDVVGPTIGPGSDLDDVTATYFLGLMQSWLRKGSGTTLDPPKRDLLNYFGCYTSVGLRLGGAEVLSLPRNDHTERVASTEFLWGKPPSDPEILNQLMPRIARALRLLQVPYPRSEQILSMVRTFRWAHQREVIWEDTVGLAPAVLCLTSHLESISSWWSEGAPAILERWPELQSAYNPGEPRGQQAYARGRLDRLHQELPLVLDAFRSSFYNRQLGGYLADETPDLNLRARGSISQLMSVANLILDTMVRRVFGPRACLVTIGDVASPVVHAPCDVIIVKLHVDVLRNPLMLDSLGHELGHWLMVELLRSPASGTEHRWLPRHGEDETGSELQATLDALQREVFVGGLRPNATFCEVAADFVEMMLLEPDDPEAWLRSKCLRALLLAPPVELGGHHQDRFDVPAPDQAKVRTQLRRATYVWIAKELIEWSGEGSFAEFAEEKIEPALEKLRRCLAEECILGPSPVVMRDVTDRWSAFVRTKVFHTARWLSDEDAVQRSRDFFRALRNHIRRPCDDVAVEARWDTVSSSMRRVRNATTSAVIPSLVIRQWVDPAETEGLEPHQLPAHYESRDMPKPWWVVPQPVIQHQKMPGGGGVGEARSVIYQRGLIFSLTEKGDHALLVDTAAALGGLFRLLPEWRESLVARMHQLEESARMEDTD